MSANDNDLSVMEEAADWIDRLDELSDAERQELAAWLNASPDHAAAFSALRHTLRDTALLEAVDRLRAEPVEALAPSPRRLAWGGWTRAGLIAAGVLVLVGGGFLGSRLVAGRAAPPIELATAVGVRADHVLSDTSTVRLNADSHASVAYSRDARDIYLRRGDAVFEVAKNRRRPFNVMAGDAKVTAVGTVFEVDKVEENAVEVRVFEGVVRVSQGGAPPRTLRQGEWLLLAADHTASRGRLAADSYDAWRGDWLEADNMPLKYVVTRLNRYSPQALTLRDPRMGDLQVTGRFKLDRPAEALAMITTLLDLKVEKAGPRIYLASPPSKARSERAI